MSDFVIVPKGPFNLTLAAEHLSCFPATSHQPTMNAGKLRLGFIADKTHAPVAVELRQEYGGAFHGRLLGRGAAGWIPSHVDAVRKQVARIFALDVDAKAFPDLAKRDPKIAPILRDLEGLRPVSFTSPYECACWAVISQRITKFQGAKIFDTLVTKHGTTIDDVRVFPTPEKLLEVTEVQSLPAPKLERLHGIALAALEGKLDAETLRRLPEADALTRLKDLPGIGEFWSSGIWLRACGVHDRFPDEPISIAALNDLHGSDANLAKRTELYRPFGMFVAFLLRITNRRLPARPVARRAASSSRLARAAS